LSAIDAFPLRIKRKNTLLLLSVKRRRTKREIGQKPPVCPWAKKKRI
jgi:hypothetical protein